MRQGIIISSIVVIVIGLAVFLFLNANTPAEDLPAVGEAYEIQGAQHIPEGSSHEVYNSNPPTSGSHYAQPANWGIYERPLADEQAIHNLEHGGIWISYRDIDEETLTRLRDLANRNRGAVILSPREDNDKKIALASWGRLENLDEFDEERIQFFIRSNKNKSPEPLAR
jgi:hypothetical protein